MILLESSFLGVRFVLLRLAFTLPGLIGVGFLMERMVLRAPVEGRAQSAGPA